MRLAASILAAILLSCPSAWAQDATPLLDWIMADAGGGDNPYSAYGPVAVWYPSRTLDYADVTENAIEATNTTSVTVSTNGWYFGGGTVHLDFGYPAVLEIGTNDYTMSAWVKPETLNPYVLYGILGKSAYAGADRWVMCLYDKRPAAILTEGTSNSIDTPKADQYEAGGWMHVCATYDRDNLMTMYVDGEFYASTNISGVAGDVTFDGNLSVPFRAGSFNDGSGRPDKCLNGWMDLAAVWRRALSASEVAEIFNLGRTP